MKLTSVALCLFAPILLVGFVIAAPTVAIAAPNPPTFYERQINKLAYPTEINLGLPTFSTRKSNNSAPLQTSDQTPPIQEIPEILTQPDEDVTFIKIRKIPPALTKLSNQLKRQLKKQIVLQVPADPARAEAIAERSRPDPYKLIAAARKSQNPLKSQNSLPPAPDLSQSFAQLNQRVSKAKNNLAQQPAQLKNKLAQARTDFQARSSQQVNAHLGRLQATFERVIKQPLRQLLERVEAIAHQNAEKLK